MAQYIRVRSWSRTARQCLAWCQGPLPLCQATWQSPSILCSTNLMRPYSHQPAQQMHSGWPCMPIPIPMTVLLPRLRSLALRWALPYLHGTLAPLEGEGRGHDAHGENAHLTCDLGNNGRRTAARATAHASLGGRRQASGFTVCQGNTTVESTQHRARIYKLALARGDLGRPGRPVTCARSVRSPSRRPCRCCGEPQRWPPCSPGRLSTQGKRNPGVLLRYAPMYVEQLPLRPIQVSSFPCAKCT